MSAKKETIVVTREQFDSYRRVQMEGKYNMLFPEAEIATGLTYKVYMECIHRYEELTRQYPLPK